MNHFTTALQKSFDFSGRATRSEYWMFGLIAFAITLITTLFDAIIAQQGGPAVITVLFTLAILPASISVSVRRMHDVGKSGWHLLTPLIPLIGGLWFLYLTIKSSEAQPNAYDVASNSEPTAAPVQTVVPASTAVSTAAPTTPAPTIAVQTTAPATLQPSASVQAASPTQANTQQNFSMTAEAALAQTPQPAQAAPPAKPLTPTIPVIAMPGTDPNSSLTIEAPVTTTSAAPVPPKQ